MLAKTYNKTVEWADLFELEKRKKRNAGQNSRPLSAFKA